GSLTAVALVASGAAWASGRGASHAAVSTKAKAAVKLKVTGAVTLTLKGSKVVCQLPNEAFITGADYPSLGADGVVQIDAAQPPNQKTAVLKAVIGKVGYLGTQSAPSTVKVKGKKINVKNL